MRALLVGALVAAGVVAGTASAFVHPIVWALVLAIVANSLTAYALPAGWERIGFVAGWAAAVIYFTVPRPEGDYIVAQNPQGFVLLGYLFVLVLSAVLTVPRRHQRARSPRE